MCNLSEGIEERGHKRGYKIGFQIGLILGFLVSIESLKETLGLSPEESMEILQIPEDERAKYRILLRQQQTSRTPQTDS